MTWSDQTHREFLSKLGESDASEMVVANWMRYLGHNVVVPRKSAAPTVADREEHSDVGDLYLAYNGDWKDVRRVEVRHHQSNQFNTRENWRDNKNPYGCIVGPVNCDHASIRYWIHLNPWMTSAYIVDAKDRPAFTKHEIRDGNDVLKDNYFVDPDLVKFVKVSDGQRN